MKVGFIAGLFHWYQLGRHNKQVYIYIKHIYCIAQNQTVHTKVTVMWAVIVGNLKLVTCSKGQQSSWISCMQDKNYCQGAVQSVWCYKYKWCVLSQGELLLPSVACLIPGWTAHCSSSRKRVSKSISFVSMQINTHVKETSDLLNTIFYYFTEIKTKNNRQNTINLKCINLNDLRSDLTVARGPSLRV